MRIKPLASLVLSCLGATSFNVFAEDVMVVTASGYEKKSPMRQPVFLLFHNKNYRPINIMILAMLSGPLREWTLKAVPEKQGA